MRCCLATVAEEYEGGDNGQDKPVSIGMKSKCRHCGQSFTLVIVPAGMSTCFRNPKFPVWKPDWQLNGHNDLDQRTGRADLRKHD